MFCVLFFNRFGVDSHLDLKGRFMKRYCIGMIIVLVVFGCGIGDGGIVFFCEIGVTNACICEDGSLGV